jgi:uncharacterized protein YraI
MEQIVAYKCGFCRKYSTSKSHMKKHEQTCYHNPDMRACATCTNMEQKTYRTKEGYVDSRPVCTCGVPISSIEGGRKSINLRHNCEQWRKLTEGDDYDIKL